MPDSQHALKHCDRELAATICPPPPASAAGSSGGDFLAVLSIDIACLGRPPPPRQPPAVPGVTPRYFVPAPLAPTCLPRTAASAAGSSGGGSRTARSSAVGRYWPAPPPRQPPTAPAGPRRRVSRRQVLRHPPPLLLPAPLPAAARPPPPRQPPTAPVASSAAARFGPRQRRHRPAPACMFISTVEVLSAVSFGGELRGDLTTRLRYDLLRQIDPFAPGPSACYILGL